MGSCPRTTSASSPTMLPWAPPAGPRALTAAAASAAAAAAAAEAKVAAVPCRRSPSLTCRVPSPLPWARPRLSVIIAQCQQAPDALRTRSATRSLRSASRGVSGRCPPLPHPTQVAAAATGAFSCAEGGRDPVQSACAQSARARPGRNLDMGGIPPIWVPCMPIAAVNAAPGFGILVKNTARYREFT
eukprot:357405-Chlamydomonas_euryale.AAC.7